MTGIEGAKGADMLKVNLGCGETQYDGWLNVDFDPACRPDMLVDLSKPLPFATGSADFLFSEDFLMQLDYEGARFFLAECRRVLKPKGVFRLLMPDLRKLVESYLHQPDWLVEIWDRFVGVPLASRSACEVVNQGIRLAGRFLFDKETLIAAAREVGLEAVEVGYRSSAYPELRELDLRKPQESVSMYFECHPI